MSVLRYISILILNLLLILESSALSVVALSEEDIAVNSLESLSLPIETIEQEIASEVNTNIAKEVQPELKLDIQSLLDANRAYAEKTTTISEEDMILSESAPSDLAILTSLDGAGVFGDFLIGSRSSLVSGDK
jgi:hypothetical protein